MHNYQRIICSYPVYVGNEHEDHDNSTTRFAIVKKYVLFSLLTLLKNEQAKRQAISHRLSPGVKVFSKSSRVLSLLSISHGISFYFCISSPLWIDQRCRVFRFNESPAVDTKQNRF